MSLRACLAISLTVAAFVNAAVLVDFQVAQPPPTPKWAKSCTVQLIERTFANSYGDPETISYTPPTDCGKPGSWAAVSLNLTTTSNGTQYDRLGVFTFNHVEIWRTSTPEPTPDGIIWTYVKDVTKYIPLFAQPGNLTFELDNIVETGLTGEYATVVHATFYESSPLYESASQADLIIPISTLAENSDDIISVQPAYSLNVTFPRNTISAFAEIYASGNGDEEFWYFNAPTEYLSDLPPDTTFGDGPFREVQLLVDSQLAGAVYPYPVIYTGGINPACWSPITSYATLDSPTYFIDLTPFVGILADGNPHTITLNVVSEESDHTINSNWYVSAALQVLTGSSSKPTTGKITSYNVSPYSTTKSSAIVNGANTDITVSASRQLSIEAEIVAGDGSKTLVVWEQSLSYSNTQNYIDDATSQVVTQTASGTFKSTHNGIQAVYDQFSYPLTINLTYLNPNFTSFSSSFDHSYDRTLLPSPFLLETTIVNHQTATGFFTETATGNTGNGTNSNTFSYFDVKGNTYSRNVDAAFGNITLDEISGTLATTPPSFPFWPKWTGLPQARLPGGKLLGHLL